jgi:hypothetical protein
MCLQPTLDARPSNGFGWKVASDSHTVGRIGRYCFGRYLDERGSDISRLARPLRTVVSSARAALNLARRPPATRDRAMNSPIVARDVGGFPGKKQCVLNRTG